MCVGWQKFSELKNFSPLSVIYDGSHSVQVQFIGVPLCALGEKWCQVFVGNSITLVPKNEAPGRRMAMAYKGSVEGAMQCNYQVQWQGWNKRQTQIDKGKQQMFPTFLPHFPYPFANRTLIAQVQWKMVGGGVISPISHFVRQE